MINFILKNLVRLILLSIMISSSGYLLAQTAGFNTTAPTATVHIVPFSGFEPLRVEGFVSFQNNDSTVLVVDPTSGEVRYMSYEELSKRITLDSSQVIRIMVNNADTLLSNQTFVTRIYNTIKDSLLKDTNFLNTLQDSIETLTTITSTDSTITYTDEDGNLTNIDVKAMIDSSETLTTITSTDSTITYTDEDGNLTTIDVKAMIDSSETLTTIASTDSTITYTDEDGNLTTIDVKAMIDSSETVTSFGSQNDSTLWYVNENYDTTKVVFGTDIDSAKLQGDTALVIYEGSKVITANLSALKDSSEWVDGAKVGLTPGAIYARKALANGDTVVVDTSGYNGLGTNNPNYPLDIVDGSTFYSLRLKGTSSNYVPGVVIENDVNDQAIISVGRSVLPANIAGDLTIQSPAANDIILRTNGNNERVRVTSTGEMGIGATAPTHKLDVNGEARIRTINDTANVAGVLTSNTNGVVQNLPIDSLASQLADSSEWIDGSKVGLTPGAIYARKALANGDTVVVDINGNMGIGTNNPVSQIHMNKAANNQFNALTIGADHASSNFELGEIAFRRSFYNPNESAATITFYRNSAASGGGLRFKTQNNPSSLDTVMDITPGGRVGIGTTTPNAKLDIEADHRNQLVIGKQGESGGILLRRNDGNATAYIGYADSLNTLTFTEGSGGGDILFRQNVAGLGSDTTIFLEGSNGNVGIGTTTPASKLTIDAGNSTNPVRVLGNSFRHLQTFINSTTSGTDNITGTAYQNNDGATVSTVGQIMYSDNTFNNPFWRKNSLAIAATRSNGTINFFTGAGTSSGIPKMLIDSNGFTGLNITSPTHRLDVNGETRIRTINDVTVTNNLLVANANGVVEKIHIDSIKGEADADFFKVGTTSAPTNINDSIFTMGNVGIKISLPQEALNIAGNFQIGDTIFPFSIMESGGLGGPFGYSLLSGGKILNTGAATKQIVKYANPTRPGLSYISMDGETGNTYFGNNNFGNTNRNVVQMDSIIRMTIASSGNVGIGTINPERKLEVAGDINVGLNTTPLVNNSYGNRLYFGGNSQNTDDLWMARYNSANDRSFLRINIGDNGSGDDAFQIGNSTFASPFMHVANNGNVGIRTNAPSQRLDVNGQARIRTITDTTATSNVLVANANGVVKKIHIDSIKGEADADFYKVGTTSAPTNINDSIYTMGNVGIGTAFPEDKLHINDSTNQRHRPLILSGSWSASGSHYNLMSFKATDSLDNDVFSDNNSEGQKNFHLGLVSDVGFFNNNRFSIIQGGIERLVIGGYNNQGNVGIGTTNPQEELEVNGEIEIAGGEAADDTRLIFAASDKSNRFRIETDLDLITNLDLLGFRTTSTDDVLVLKGDGKVGIGITVPQKHLHVNANNDSLQFDNLAGTGNVLTIDANGKVFRGTADATISSIKTVTTNSTALNGDATILVDATGGDRTITLPSVTSLPVGKKYIIKKIDGSTNNVIIDPIGAETIDGAATRITSNPFDAIVIQSNGSAWFIIN